MESPYFHCFRIIIREIREGNEIIQRTIKYATSAPSFWMSILLGSVYPNVISRIFHKKKLYGMPMKTVTNSCSLNNHYWDEILIARILRCPIIYRCAIFQRTLACIAEYIGIFLHIVRPRP